MQETLRGCSDTLRTALTTTTGYQAMTTATTARGKSVSTNLVWGKWCGSTAHCGERTVIDMRLIDGDALMEVINRHCYPVQHDMTSIEPGMTRIGILQAIQEQPTIEPERKKGRWIVRIWEHGGTYGECSLCGLKQGAGYLNFCPNCGSYNGGAE